MSRFETTTRHPHSSTHARARWTLSLLGMLLAVAAAPVGAQEAPDTAPVSRAGIENSRDLPYALVRAGAHDLIRRSDGDADVEDWLDARQLRKRIDGDFLWFRDGGKPYVIRDPAVLDKARAAWAPVDRLGEQMDAYGRDMDKQGRVMDALGKEMGHAAAGIQPDEAKMHAIERQMDALGREIGSVAERMVYAAGDERTRLNAQMKRLNTQMGELGRQMGEVARSDAQLSAEQSMREVSLRMNEAGKPMNELGKKMGALGKDMARESRGADRNVRVLIRDAMALGLAQPAPQG